MTNGPRQALAGLCPLRVAGGVMMATEAVLRGGEGARDRTDRDGPETPAFPVHKETDEWEGVGSSWRIPPGQSPFLQACP